MNVPMTDYYPLIDTAVAALENNTSAARRTVYEYARSALVRQSRNKIPPLTETELACERLALEQAILRVQAEQGRRSSRDPSRTYSSDVRPQEPTAERAPPCHAVPSNPAPGPRSQPNPSSARREAPARREPPPVARREQAVPPRPTTSGVGARDVANQPPSPAPPPRLRFPLFDRRNQEVANHPGTRAADLAPPARRQSSVGIAAGCRLLSCGFWARESPRSHLRRKDRPRRQAEVCHRPTATSRDILRRGRASKQHHLML